MEKGYSIPVLGDGYVRYIDHLGTDTRIVETARISYGSASKGAELDRKLLFYLYKNSHTSPFESCNITFNIKMPIFVMRQFVRHRTMRLNEISGRYTEMKDEFFIPNTWRIQDPKNKQGSIVPDYDQVWHGKLSKYVEAHFKDAYEVYKTLLAEGVAKEQARIVLPVALYTEIYVNVDVHNLLHFMALRQHSHAQSEIQEVANAMSEIFAELFPWCNEARNKYIRKMVEVEQ